MGKVKYLVKVFAFNMFGLWLTSQILPALVISPGWQPMVTAGLVLSLLMLIVRPILTILFIPINILTFGLLSWFINVIVIFLLTLFVPEVVVTDWTFPGLNWAGLVIPIFHLSYFLALIVVSLTITFFTNLLHDLSE